MSENKEMPAKNRIVHPRTELRWPPFHSNLLNEAFLTSVKGVFDEMLGRLYYGADKRKGWATAEPWKELTEHECRTCIRDSLAKGKLIDAMNYLMFAHLNGHKLLSLRNPSTDEPVSIDSQMRDQLANALGVTGRNWDEMLAMVGALKLKRPRTTTPSNIVSHTGKVAVTIDGLDLTTVADDSGIPSALFHFKNEKDRGDYLPLLRTFLGALEQAAYGKGRERHANDLPFTEQPILTMARMLDSDAGLAQQVIKKTIEARSLPSKKARVNELRGTLVYAAAMILFEEMYGRADDPDELDGNYI